MCTDLEGCKGIRGYVESRHLHKTKEVVELFRVEHYFAEWLVANALSQHHATVECYFRIFIPIDKITCKSLMGERRKCSTPHLHYILLQTCDRKCRVNLQNMSLGAHTNYKYIISHSWLTL